MRVPVALPPCQHVLRVLDFNHSDKYILTGLSHCGFELHFSDDISCRVLFHTLICHLYNFFGEVSVQASDPFSNRILFLLLSC